MASSLALTLVAGAAVVAMVVAAVSSPQASHTAATTAAVPTVPTGCNVTGTWKDAVHGPQTWRMAESASRGLTLQGPWPGSPAGQLEPDSMLWVLYSASNNATAVLTTCDFM